MRVDVVLWIFSPRGGFHLYPRDTGHFYTEREHFIVRDIVFDHDRGALALIRGDLLGNYFHGYATRLANHLEGLCAFSRVFW